MALKDQYSTNLGLGDIPEIDQKKYPQIWEDSLRIRNALKIIQAKLDSYTGALSEDPQYWGNTPLTNSARVQNIAKIYAKAGENIGLAQVVNLYNNAGTLAAVRANATNSLSPCKAFCSTGGGVLSGAWGEFVLMGLNPYYSGLTIGATYYLSLTSGQITLTAPTTVGNIVQPVGYALSTTDLWFNPPLSYLTL